MQNTNRVGEKNWKTVGSVALAVGLLMVSGAAMAAGADPTGDGICKLVTLLKGKALFGTTIVATIAAGLGVMFGGEMDAMLKKIVTFLFVVGLVMGMASLLTLAFSAIPGFLACP